MGRPKSNNVQINISIPMEWKTELENLANAGIEVDERNILPVTYLDKKGEKRPCYKMSKE